MLGRAERSVKVTGTGVAAQQQEMQNGSGNLQIEGGCEHSAWCLDIRNTRNASNSQIHAARWIRCNSRCTSTFRAELPSLINYVWSATWMNVNGMENQVKQWQERQKECMHGYCSLQRKTGNALGLIIGKFLTAIVIDLLFSN